MEQPATSGSSRPKGELVRVVVETNGAPVLNLAAATVLLRILLRAQQHQTQSQKDADTGR